MDIPAYTPYTQQARHRAIESTLLLSAEALQLPEVIHRLGWYATALTTIIDRATVPNIRNDEIVLEGCGTDRTPIIAVHIGERVLRRSKDLTFNPSQKYVINKTYKSGVARDIFQYQTRFYGDGPDLIEVPALTADTTLARVHADHLENDDGAWPMRLYSRPLVQLNLDAHQTQSPVVALHEFTHVMQVNSKPITRADTSNLPAELEAYYVAAQVIQGYRDAGRQDELLRHTSHNNQATALEVEVIRDRHNGPITEHRPFIYSRELAEDLAMSDLEITPSISALVNLRRDATV